jgi:predicted GNAT superfamily acetyltransferase
LNYKWIDPASLKKREPTARVEIIMITANLSRKVDDEIIIRRAESIADYRACQDAQRGAWGISDESYLVPIATMVGANLHGGLVLGAFLPEGAAVAMSFAFLGRVEDRLCLYSQLTGVVPGYQSRGLGLEIKRLQRTIARAEGIKRIAWAFDPMQAGNAHFNLARLGASAGIFVENMYGLRTDALNAGVPTDRLIAEWDTRDDGAVVVPSHDVATLPHLIETEQGRGDVPGAPLGIDKPAFQAQPILLEIPNDIVLMRRESPEIAELWRSIVAPAFQLAFAAGYRAVHFVRDDSLGRRRSFYVLERI